MTSDEIQREVNKHSDTFTALALTTMRERSDLTDDERREAEARLLDIEITPATPAKACGNPDCCCSSGIHDGITFGSGELDQFGFWEFPCRPCAVAADARMAAGERDRLIAHYVDHYRSLGHTPQAALLQVQRDHQWVYLAAWPYA